MKIQASLLDLISAAMDSANRPLDGLVIFRLTSERFSLDQLEAGANSARHFYPVSASRLEDKAWCFSIDATPTITQATADSEEERLKIIADFLQQRPELQTTPSFRQLLLTSPRGMELVTFAHHAAADLLSVLNWKRYQLDVAAGRIEPGQELSHDDRPVLKSHENPVRKSRYSKPGPSTKLWRRHDSLSPTRHFQSLNINAAAFRQALEKHEDITYNDVLITALLETFYRWNRSHDAPTKRIALWCPVNIRSEPFQGFGNGSSRIRIYSRLKPEEDFKDRCRETRQQIRWSKKDGEWFVPPSSALLQLPTTLMNLVARLYFNRPWVDMATAPFSHVERMGTQENIALFPEVESMEVIGELHRYFPIGLSGVTFRGKTTITNTYDPAMLNEDDVQEFNTLLEATLNNALKELSL